MIKIALGTIACPMFTASQAAEAVLRNSYDGIELYALYGRPLTPDRLEDNLEEIRRELAGVDIASINSWAKLSNSDPDERRVTEVKINRTFELASELCSPLVKAFPGDIPLGMNRDEVIVYMTEMLQRLVPRAKQLGVTLVVETHDGFCLGSELKTLLSGVDDPNIAAIWDVYHPYRLGESVVETDQYIGDRVRHVHVTDAIRHGNGWKFVAMGEGELPVQGLIDCLRARNYDGYIAVDYQKMWHAYLDEPEVALPQQIEVLRHYIESP